MPFKDSFLPEFESEMVRTRKTLERVPDDKFGWKPHEKSTAMGALSSHLANLVGYAGIIFNDTSIDMAPKAGAPVRAQFSAKTRQELLDEFDRNLASARVAIQSATDAQLQETWTLFSGEKVIFALPRSGVLRAMVLSHMIHHRAQLGVYLRLNDIPVPSIYGPSADEPI